MKKYLKIAISCFILVFAFSGLMSLIKKNDTPIVLADNSIYNDNLGKVSQIYYDAGDIILSVEKVVAHQGTPQDTGSYDNMKTTGNSFIYFKNINRTVDGVIKDKYIVQDKEFVMLNNSSLEFHKEKVMVSVGAYYFNQTGEMKSNSTGDNARNKLKYLTVNAKLNGVEYTVSNPRNYGTEHKDFVMLLDGNAVGKYEFNIIFMYENENITSPEYRRSFTFYMLSENSYVNTQTVNSNLYTTQPNFEANTTAPSDKEGSVYLNNKIHYFNTDYNVGGEDDKNGKYPTLTYDFDKYALSYKKTYLDSVTQVAINYNKANSKLVFSSTTMGRTTTKEYAVDAGNTIVSLVFVELGDYVFNSNVIYYDGETKMEVNANQVAVKPQKLVIYGVNAIYSKVNTYQAQLRRLEIFKNGTNCILVEGYQSDSEITFSSNVKVGNQYELITPIDDNEKTGTIKTRSTQTASKKTIVSANSANNAGVTVNFVDFESVDKFVQTNQSPIWFDSNATISYFIAGTGTETNFSHYYYAKDINGLQSASAVSLNKGKSFGAIGYYLVAIKYEYKRADLSDTNIVYVTQIMAFRIVSTGPNLTMKASSRASGENYFEDGLNALSDGNFTNKNVYITWNKSGYFDTKTEIRYWRSPTYKTVKSEMDQKNMLYDERGSLNDGKTNYGRLFDQKGTYIIQASYGGSSVQEYMFTIDQDQISGLSVLGVAAQKTSVSGINYIFDGTSYNQGAIDKMVSLMWNNKASGAATFAKYQFTPFVKNNSVAEPVNLLNEQWVTTSYGLGTTTGLLNFEKAASTLSSINKNYVLSEQGIYTFEIYDDAGNSTNYMVIIDKTPARIVQTPLGDNIYNLVKQDVTLSWGSHKALKLFEKSGAGAYAKLFEYLSEFNTINSTFNYYSGTNSNKDNIEKMFKSYNGDNFYYFLVPNKEVNIIKDSNSSDINVVAGSLSSYKTTFYINATAGNNFSGEGVYYAYILGTNQIYNNIATSPVTTTKANYKDSRSYHMVELNKDTSQGMIYSADDENNYISRLQVQTSNKEAINNIIFGLNSDVTNKRYVVFEFLMGEGSDEITSLYYNYYPYDETETSSAYYPYSATETKTESLLENITPLTVANVSGQTDREGKYRTMPLNVAYTTYFDKDGNKQAVQATAPGMYVVTRKIDGAVDQSDKFRHYRFYVDRNGIITFDESANERDVGKNINITLQNGTTTFDSYTKVNSTSKVTYTYIDQLTGITTNKVASTILETNLLPVKMEIPLSKYYTTKNSKIAAFGLNLKIYFRATGAFKQDFDLPYDIEANVNESGPYISFGSGSEFSQPGTYLVELTDGTGESSNLTALTASNKNSLLFAIIVTAKKPGVDIYAKPSAEGAFDNQLFSGESVDGADKTTSDYLAVVIDDPLDKYQAKVDLDKIAITRRLIDADEGSYLTYYMKNGAAVTPPGNITIYQKIAIGTYSGKVLSEADKTAILNNTYLGDLTDIRYRHIYKLNFVSATSDTNTLTVNSNGGVITNYLQYVYKISVQFKGNGANYVYQNSQGDSVNYYTNDIYIVVDRTPSVVNLNNLIASHSQNILEHNPNLSQASDIKQNDAYRKKNGAGTYDYNDYYTTSLSENYSFAVTPNTAYTNKLNLNTEIEKVYFRKLFISEQDFIDEFGINEDLNNNGQLDSGEDLNENGVLDLGANAFSVNKKRALGKAALLPGDVRYHLANEYLDFLRFSEAVATAEGYITAVDKLRNINTFGGLLADDNGNIKAGYYEIIEKDSAGNLTSYIVLINTGEQNVSIEAECVDSESEIREIAAVENLYIFEIEQIINIDYFSKITINKVEGSLKTQLYSIYTDFESDMSTIVGQINHVIGHGKYEIIIKNRYQTATFNVNIFDSQSSLNRGAIKVLEETDGSYYFKPGDAINFDAISNLEFGIKKLTLTERGAAVSAEIDNYTTWNYNITNSVYNKLTLNASVDFLFKNIKIKLRQEKVYELILTDILGKNGDTIILSTINQTIAEDFYVLHNPSDPSVYKDITFTLGSAGRNYGANYTLEDNYRFMHGDYYYTTKPVVVTISTTKYNPSGTFEKMFIYRINQTTGAEEDITNTSDIVSDLTKDSTDSTNPIIYKVVNNGTTSLIFMPSNFTYNFGALGKALSYRIELYDDNKMEIEKTYNFVIDNSSPSVNFLDEQLVNKNNIAIPQNTTSYTSTSDAIIISWGNFSNSLFNYKVALEKRIIGENGTLSTQEIDITQQNDYVLSPNNQEGSYVLHIYTYNPTGMQQLLEDRYFAFTIRVSDVAMYSVKYAATDKLYEYETSLSTTWDEIKDYVNIDKLKDVKEEYPTSIYNAETLINLYMSTQQLSIITNADKNIELKCVLAPNGGHVTGTGIKYYTKNASGYELYLYRITSLQNSEYSFEEFVCIVKVPVADDAIINPITNKKMLTTFEVNIDTRSNKKQTLLLSDNSYRWLPLNEYLLTFNSWNKGHSTNNDDVFAQKNKLILDIYYYDVRTTSVYGSNTENSSLLFDYEGKYSIVVRDMAGNKIMFGSTKSEKFVLTLFCGNEEEEYSMPVTINDKPAPNNAYYNGTVILKIKDSGAYVAYSIISTVTINGVPIPNLKPDKGTTEYYTYSFTQAGTYVINIKAQLLTSEGIKNISKSLVFTIINSTESRLTLDLTNIYNSYKILTVKKNNQIITTNFVRLLESAYNTDASEQENQFPSQLISYDRLQKQIIGTGVVIGAGRFEITYRIQINSLLPVQDVTFAFWINNETPSILSSIKDGESSTKTIKIMYNPYIIHQQIGDCYIVINNVIYASIKNDSANNNSLQEIVLNQAADYFVQVVTDSGKIISSFRVTKNEPLNAVSIALIVIGCILVVGGITIFIVLRKRVKVR